jgi:hypothetical protein
MLPVAIAIADWLVDNLEVLTLGGMDYRGKLIPQNSGRTTEKGGSTPKPPPMASWRFFLDKAFDVPLRPHGTLDDF